MGPSLVAGFVLGWAFVRVVEGRRHANNFTVKPTSQPFWFHEGLAPANAGMMVLRSFPLTRYQEIDMSTNTGQIQIHDADRTRFLDPSGEMLS